MAFLAKMQFSLSAESCYLRQYVRRIRAFIKGRKHLGIKTRSPFIITLLSFFLFYLPYLSSIHEKANCIAILWTVSPHSLGSCLFRGFYGPPVFHIKVGRPVKCLAQGHNKRTCRLVLHNLPEMPSAKQGSCGYHFLKSFGMTRQGE